MGLLRTVSALVLAAASTLAARPTSGEPAPWSAPFPAIREDVEAGRPFVAYVVVPLCSNAQIDCGSPAAGRPRDLGTNLYWGAVFGMRRFFERRSSGWELVERVAGEGPSLDRVVYRRRAAGEGWGRTATVEQLVVFEAFDGAEIDRAVRRFWTLATEGGRVSFVDGDKHRDARIHVVGYAGHNRLMDGLELPAARRAAERAPAPSFVLACRSESYFDAALRAAGSQPLVTTRALMAPEAYAVDALVRGLGDGKDKRAVREGVVRAYAKWQRLSFGTASAMFSP